MCNKCADLDRLSGHLRKMIPNLADPRLVAVAEEMIAEMEFRRPPCTQSKAASRPGFPRNLTSHFR